MFHIHHPRHKHLSHTCDSKRKDINPFRKAGIAQWWEHSPPTNVARVPFPDPMPLVGWVCVGCLLCFKGFSPGSPVFLPHQKPTYSLFHLAVSCATRSDMDRIAAAGGAIVSFRFNLVELRRCCTLQWRLAERIIIIIISESKLP